MNTIQLVIPAAGKGSRFKEAGYAEEKPLIQLHGIPLLLWVIFNFNLSEGDKLFVIVNKEFSVEEFCKNYLVDVKFDYEFIALDKYTDGAARTVSTIESKIDLSQPLVIANSDQFVLDGLNKFINKVKNLESSGLILTMKAFGSKWSYITFNESNLVTGVKEKEEISSEATVGIYAWSTANLFFNSFKEMLKANDTTNNEFYVAPTYNYLIKKNLKIEFMNIGEIEHNIIGLGVPLDFESFRKNRLSLNIASTIHSFYNL
jgi:dTDP-glucose pyrophosphorylase